MNDYYSIDDIITDGQKLPCNFEISVPGLGYLQGEPGTEIKENTKLELPLWLAEMLAISGVSEDSQTSFVTLLEPPMFSEKVINALKSDPVNVDIGELSPVFYRLLQRWLAIFPDPEMAIVAIQTLQARVAAISDFSHNPRGAMADTNNFLHKLEQVESRLYKASYESSKDLRKWLSKESGV
ncbi:DNA replication complex GINS protein Psf3p [Trichomonascus vanleenenianus]|uniref:DNA replication protein PSF3 n=1 Tax=Trichomonascus vanleenenianus TaxID=2268995 RepID=UPI003EC9A30E